MLLQYLHSPHTTPHKISLKQDKIYFFKEFIYLEY